MSYIQNKLDELIETYRKEMTIHDSNGDNVGELIYLTEYDVRMIAEQLETSILERLKSLF